MVNNFVHLHTHTKYSLQDGTIHPEDMMKKCVASGMKSVAITDHGSMAGIWECAKWASKYGIGLIPGSEFYLVPDGEKSRGNDWGRGKSAHIILLAMDQRGYFNLLKLTAIANLVNFYHEPRIDYKALAEHSEGLFCLTGCLGGVFGKAVRNGQSAALALDKLQGIFGDRLSLEIQLNDIPEQEVLNDALISLHKKTKVPLVATVDSHYLDKKDSSAQDMLFAIQLGKSLDDPTRLRMPDGVHSFETPDEVIPRFVSKYGVLGEAAIGRTIEIAENCKFKIQWESKNYKIPTLDLCAQPDWNEFLKYISDCSCHVVEGKCLMHEHH